MCTPRLQVWYLSGCAAKIGGHLKEAKIFLLEALEVSEHNPVHREIMEFGHADASRISYQSGLVRADATTQSQVLAFQLRHLRDHMLNRMKPD